MKYFFLLLSITIFTACDTADDTTSETCSDAPLENIQWLNDLVSTENPNGLEIIQYDYNEQTVFSINACINCSDNLILVYDCDKNKICEFGSIAGLNTCPDFYTEATNETLLFTNRDCDKGTPINSKLYKTLEASDITSIELNENCLNITFNILSTQDRINDVTLVDSGEILESTPIQRKLKFSIEENLTKPTIIEVSTSFNISNLAKVGETILLNIDGYKDAIEYTRTL